MELKWKYLLMMALSITFTKAEGITYLKLMDSLHPLKILKGLEENLDTNTSCINDIEEYQAGLSTDELWALQMYDSSAKFGDGFLLRGQLYLGQYDECLTVEHPKRNFIGQYCMINTIIYRVNGTSIIPDLDNDTMVLRTYANLTDPSKTEFFHGFCLPSTCSRPEINTALNKTFNNTMFEGNVSMQVPEFFCHTRESSLKLKTGTWVTIGFLILITGVALTSTFYDLYLPNIQDNKNWRFHLQFFSLYKNGKQLFQTKTSDQLKMLNGIRVFSILWVILHNGYILILYDAPVVDSVGIFKRFMDHNHIITTHGYIAVDSFFFLSGLLASFVFFHEIGKKGSYDVPMAYLNRYVRLTPSYAAMILITSTLFIYLGNGPLWDPMTQTYLVNLCQKNWWLALLYVDNWTKDWKCIPPTWYLAVDMQLHWISPLILYPLHFWPSLASAILCAVILGAGLITFTNAYVNSLGPSIEITTNNEQFGIDYKMFHTRAAPWLIGMAIGYAICTIKARKIKIRLAKIWIIIGWLASTGLCLGSLYGVTSFTNYKYTNLEASFYLAFHRVGWGLGIAWIVFACVYGYGGPVNTFLSWNLFQPLGKLSYGAFLIHWLIIVYRTGVTRVNIHGSDTEQAYFFMGDAILSFLAAIPLALLFEMPFRNIYKHYFQNVKILPLPRQKKQSNQELEESHIVKQETGEGKEKSVRV